MTITTQKYGLRLDTRNYTLEDIRKEVDECVALLESLGYNMSNNRYKVFWNTRAYKRHGQCRYRGINAQGNLQYELNFNQHYFRVGDSKNIHNTIMHEVCHSVAGCMNHQEAWKSVVNRVNNKFGYSISRTSSDPNYRAEVLDARAQAISHVQYQFHCSCCNRVVSTYQRKTKAVVGVMSNPSNWRCGRCGKTGTLSVKRVVSTGG